MAVDLENSPYLQTLTRTQDGLGYSRHYAQRIRDMGRTSKDSWIKRLWNHMFQNKEKEKKPEPKDSEGSPKASHKNTTFPPISANQKTSQNQPPSAFRQPNNSSNTSRQTKEVTFSPEYAAAAADDGDREGSRSAPPRGRDRDKQSSHDISLGNGKTIPAKLADSPYIPARVKDKYTVVPDKKITASDRVRKSHGERESRFMRTSTHPYLSSHKDEWRPKLTRGVSIISIEKRAKHTAEKAMKEAKIFTCDGPYPLDCYVRWSMRQRGWVEKFGPKASNCTRSTPDRLMFEDDEDFEAIIEQDVPAPWEEENGLYAIMSRIVRHYPAKFIWGGRNVNHLVLRSEVMVNHFPKARYFSSKVGLTQSLRELVWLNSQDSQDFFPRCYTICEDEKDDIIEDFRLTTCVCLLKWVMKMYTQTNTVSDNGGNYKYEEVTFNDGETRFEPGECMEDEVEDVEVTTNEAKGADIHGPDSVGRTANGDENKNSVLEKDKLKDAKAYDMTGEEEVEDEPDAIASSDDSDSEAEKDSLSKKDSDSSLKKDTPQSIDSNVSLKKSNSDSNVKNTDASASLQKTDSISSPKKTDSGASLKKDDSDTGPDKIDSNSGLKKSDSDPNLNKSKATKRENKPPQQPAVTKTTHPDLPEPPVCPRHASAVPAETPRSKLSAKSRPRSRPLSRPVSTPARLKSRSGTASKKKPVERSNTVLSRTRPGSTDSSAIPDLKKPKSKGAPKEVPVKAVEWCLSHLDRYLRHKSHEDIENQPIRRPLNETQWDTLTKWFSLIANDGAMVPMTETKLRDCENMLNRMKKIWPQFELDGDRNVWIIKPGDKSKGIGIEFVNHLEDILKYLRETTAGSYVLQKYVERPLLVFKCKFDIRQWFLVTDWNPLTVWFYKESYLRICSQEFSYDTMHEAVHLSNVAVQQNYQNGERSSRIPDDNFMTSSEFKRVLSEAGEYCAWDEVTYPSMKEAIVSVLLATSDVSENRKTAFELYGADFILTEDFKPWLLEINASPGMAPSSLVKAKLCAAVIEDTIKVVLDRKENRHANTGKFELAFKDTPLPNSKCVDTKFLLEGQRIRRVDLAKYQQFDLKMAHKEELERRKREKVEDKPDVRLPVEDKDIDKEYNAKDLYQNDSDDDNDMSSQESTESVNRDQSKLNETSRSLGRTDRSSSVEKSKSKENVSSRKLDKVDNILKHSPYNNPARIGEKKTDKRKK